MQSVHIQAAEYLAAWDTTRQFAVDRCRHPSVTGVTLWIFEEGAGQVGAVAEEPGERWRATRMASGLPYGQRTFASLTDALEFAATR